MQVLKMCAEQPLDQLEHVLAAHEAHLDVDLGELGLPVAARVLVAEAAGDLEVLVEARHHEDLLEQLRRLRKGVELARVQARGHQVVAGALGGALHEHRGVDLVETPLDKVLARGKGGRVAQGDLPLHGGRAQVEVTVLEPGVFLCLRLLVDHEGQDVASAENGDPLGFHLDLTCGHAGVHHGRGTGRTVPSMATQYSNFSSSLALRRSSAASASTTTCVSP